MWCLALVAFAGLAFGASAQTAPSPSVDVMLVLDNSGSMRKNDPNRLLRQAVSDFATHLRGDHRIGIVLFDHRVEQVLGLTDVSDVSFNSSLSDSLSRVDFSGQWTDIPGGIERAIYTLTRQGRPDALLAVVFFTDGIIETGDRAKDLERGRWLRENLAAEAEQRGIRVFGVAFTEAADYQLIQSVSQSTGGGHHRVLKSSDIAEAFESIRNRILERFPVPPEPPPAGAPVAPFGWPVFVAGAIGLAALAVAFLVLLRRGAVGNVPPADFAHLIDVGGHTGQSRVPLRKRRIRIGRDVTVNDVCIAEDTISSQHASIEYREGSFFLKDLRSANGTFVNGKRISDPDSVREVILKPRDRIRFDAYEFVFDLDALSGESFPGAEEVPAGRRTVLRREPGPGAHEGGPPPPASSGRPAAGAAAAPGRVPPAPTIKKVDQALNAPAETLVRPEFCPTHPAWRATELCPACGRGRCKQCMTEKDGKVVCTECAIRADA